MARPAARRSPRQFCAPQGCFKRRGGPHLPASERHVGCAHRGGVGRPRMPATRLAPPPPPPQQRPFRSRTRQRPFRAPPTPPPTPHQGGCTGARRGPHPACAAETDPHRHPPPVGTTFGFGGAFGRWRAAARAAGRWGGRRVRRGRRGGPRHRSAACARVELARRVTYRLRSLLERTTQRACVRQLVQSSATDALVPLLRSRCVATLLPPRSILCDQCRRRPLLFHLADAPPTPALPPPPSNPSTRRCCRPMPVAVPGSRAGSPCRPLRPPAARRPPPPPRAR